MSPSSETPVRVRRFAPEDSVTELTRLLHRAYAPLAEAGLHYYASHQDVTATEERLAKGEGWVAAAGDGQTGYAFLLDRLGISR